MHSWAKGGNDLRLQFDEEAAYMEQYLREYIKEHHMQQSAVALEAAIRFHHGQKRTEGRPYIIHPMMLAMHGICLLYTSPSPRDS